MLGSMLSIFIAVLQTVTIGQGCLRGNNEEGLPPFQDYSSSPGFNKEINTNVIPHAHQAIIPSYKFNCCGSITEWRVDVFSNSDDNTKFRYFLDLQIWRPSTSVQKSGCYSRVGSNNFTSMSQDSRIAVLTPLPQERIKFQPGDVLGFYVESPGRDTKGVTVIEDFNVTGDRGYETEEVWHVNVEQLIIANRNCPFAVGSRGQLNILTRAAPVISVSVDTVECSRQPVISSTPIVTPPTSDSLDLLTTSTNTSAATTNIGSIKMIILGAAIAAVVLVSTSVSPIAIFSAAVWVKVKRHSGSNEDLHVAKNEAFGAKVQQGVTVQLQRKHLL